VIPDEFRVASPATFVVETFSVNKFNNLASQWTLCVSVLYLMKGSEFVGNRK